LKTYLLSVGLLALTLSGCAASGARVGNDRQDSLDNHVQLGLNYIADGNRQMARTHLLRALEIDRRSAAAHHGMALLFQLESEKELAEKHFKQALAYDGRFTRARNNYGIFLFQEGRLEEAYDQFKIASDDVNYDLRAQVFYSRGLTADRLGKQEDAKEAWGKAIALSPRYALPYLELGEFYFRRGEPSEARRYLDAYDQLAQPIARSLWLAVRIARAQGDKDAEASKGLALEKLFPDSRERGEYQEWLKDEAR